MNLSEDKNCILVEGFHGNVDHIHSVCPWSKTPMEINCILCEMGGILTGLGQLGLACMTLYTLLLKNINM